MWPHNPATGFRPPSATVVSAEPFSHGTWTLWCLQKQMATYRHWSVSLWREPDNVPHCRILSPDKTEWQLISIALVTAIYNLCYRLIRGSPTMTPNSSPTTGGSLTCKSVYSLSTYSVSLSTKVQNTIKHTSTMYVARRGNYKSRSINKLQNDITLLMF